MKNLELVQKNQIFEQIQEIKISRIGNTGQLDFKILLEFALDLELNWWLLENLEKFDILSLLKIMTILIDENERINTLITKKILDWSNFIQNGDNYKEFAGILESRKLKF